MAEIDYVFALRTTDRYVAAVVEDELTKSLEKVTERLDGYRFDLVLEKRDSDREAALTTEADVALDTAPGSDR